LTRLNVRSVMFWHKFSTVSALELDIENTFYVVHGEYILWRYVMFWHKFSTVSALVH
jgi:hypothetical protein